MLFPIVRSILVVMPSDKRGIILSNSRQRSCPANTTVYVVARRSSVHPHSSVVVFTMNPPKVQGRYEAS